MRRIHNSLFLILLFVILVGPERPKQADGKPISNGDPPVGGVCVPAVAAAGDPVAAAPGHRSAANGAPVVAVATGNPAVAQRRPTGVVNAAFLCTNGVFNSELFAPFDVLQHTKYRDDKNYVRCFIVSPDGGTFRTAEGVDVAATESFESMPRVDILVIPSTETSTSADLTNDAYMAFVRRSLKTARWVITVCDGAFPLAATGVLDGRSATTFPADRARLAEMFPAVDVRDDVRLVVDGRFITSVGGGMSYEPAFYLVEHLYGREHAERSARGLVWPWNLQSVPAKVKR